MCGFDIFPPGSDRLVLQTYWSPGLRFPSPEARGAVIGFSDMHTCVATCIV